MKVFFDTEFTGLTKQTTIISLGMISEDGRHFYAEFTDYDTDQCDEWIRENVLANLRFTLPNDGEDFYHVESRVGDNPIGNNLYSSYSVETQGPRGIVAIELRRWLNQFGSVEFISDVCHYDMVLLIDMFDHAFNLPKNVCGACYDINQDIARKYDVSMQEAFDMSREEILKNCWRAVEGEKHNALYDAKVIREIYRGLNY